jgi:tetratricopeptide (TPR) repeat protein
MMRHTISLAMLALMAGCAGPPRPVPVDERPPIAPVAPQVPTVPVRPEPEPESEVVVSPLEDVAIAAQPLDELAVEPLEPSGPGAPPPPLRLPPETAPPPASSPAVVALVEEAERLAAGGDDLRAIASLERALQIEPENPWLWHRLARVRLIQDLPDQARQLALRSNSLAAGNHPLQADNWRLIAAAHRREGNVSEANAAEARAAALAPRRG